MWNQGHSQSTGGITSHKAVISEKATLQILPCTVSQLLSASQVSNNAFAICDWKLNQVSVVGIIRGYSPFVTNIQYSVDDMTGPPLNVKQWVNAEDCALMTFASPGTYVKVTGTLRSFSVFDVNMNTTLASLSGSCSGGQPEGPLPNCLSTIQDQVLHAIRKSSDCDSGISFHDLKTQLDYLSMRDIRPVSGTNMAGTTQVPSDTTMSFGAEGLAFLGKNPQTQGSTAPGELKAREDEELKSLLGLSEEETELDSTIEEGNLDIQRLKSRKRRCHVSFSDKEEVINPVVTVVQRPCCAEKRPSRPMPDFWDQCWVSRPQGLEEFM
ncbi:replication protein A 32 kDa subunit-like protein [Lates japonicus]|uniref:Replication protein A 32 kDa subunit-like protein n=1 Tax=Lates japonicus TaxID=270547 RepID=A0AAD3MY69_LATJO|nr:replication protein A 32 kDa subunit-like protein [Lates japonicus]